MSEAPVAVTPTVLVVDDEEDLRDIMRRMLERRGFAALVAGDPDEAIAVCRDHVGDINALVTDLTLPGGASGGELAATLITMRPKLVVVYISGLPKDIAVAKGLVGPDALLVKKPFTADALLAALKKVLGDEEGGPPPS
ncbi:response regulator [Actinoplanes awajinensis]|uniref:Response regulator receiver protein n=1 Tax=Actinoplanes awajinensis subsp. mycoplanecinus TaxID=135947 RepID=A0A124G8I6_9ACTN|nr:response regulator [Actinoplanes awajinensis]KUL26002.1 response regulator receiver protein [Actinoplanes awajinensis subsp. mycoplanecinus]